MSTRKERERELRRYETIIQAVGDPVYALDDDGYFTFVNDAVTELAGYDPEDLRGEHATTVVSAADFERSAEYIEQLRSDESVSYVTFEVDIHTADGDTVPTENHIALLEDEDGHRGTAGVIRDISERKRREKRLQKFASVVSHDLQSPLNVITGRAQLAKETGSVEHVDGIVQAADRMETLIEDLLTLARQGRTVGEPESTPLSDAARDAWEQVQSPAATLTVDAETTLSADPDRLRELLVNLFRNAVEHAGPDVDVSVETLPDRSGFAVADDGPGNPR
ncbi:PAS domain S-box protein [Halapricum sp. CBA1109]|uniref:PAS domain S-box protein n=1 Tax=Halapricum sp. CBA1109 TaxID=2668068 RepID=UPI00351B4AF9